VPPAPDAAALTEARVSEARLLASYDVKIATLPLHKRAPLQVERAIHATHLAALRGTSHERPASRPVQNLPAELRASAQRLRRLALAAVDGSHAALLASIAAAHAAVEQ